MMDSKIAFKGMIEIYQNDFKCGYKGEDKEKLRLLYLELIVEVTRLVENIRYCDNKKCSCSPEFHIKYLVENNQDEIKKIFDGNLGLSSVPLPYIRKFLYSFVKGAN